MTKSKKKSPDEFDTLLAFDVPEGRLMSSYQADRTTLNFLLQHGLIELLKDDRSGTWFRTTRRGRQHYSTKGKQESTAVAKLPAAKVRNPKSAWDLAAIPYEDLTEKQKQIVRDGAAEGLHKMDPGLARMLDAFVKIGKTDFYEEYEKAQVRNDAMFEQMAKIYDAERGRIREMRGRGEKFPQTFDRKRNRFNLGHNEIEIPLELIENKAIRNEKRATTDLGGVSPSKARHRKTSPATR